MMLKRYLKTLLRLRPSFVMVGTVEPRKGHAEALAAFEILMGARLKVNLGHCWQTGLEDGSH